MLGIKSPQIRKGNNSLNLSLPDFITSFVGSRSAPGFCWLDSSTPPRRAALLVHGADDVERLVELQEARWVLGNTTQTWRDSAKSAGFTDNVGIN